MTVNAPVAWWKVALGFVAFLWILALMHDVSGGIGLLLLAAAAGLGGLAASVWGYDSRDGCDWETHLRP